MTEPMIIQGGMGAGVSSWQLAKAVSQAGQLGVVSGTALDIVLARRLQQGDPTGDLRRALSQFPIPAIAERIIARYFRADGLSENAPFANKPMHTVRSQRTLLELTVAANFVEVFLAKEGHQGLVGINLLEKIQLPNLASIYGAILAGVDYVLMGAGIPLEIPGAIDRLTAQQPASLKVHVAGAAADDVTMIHFDPQAILGQSVPALKRPKFLAIIASTTLAMTLQKRATGRVDGFVVEGPTAGGHNAPPRGTLQLDETGQPIYGARDEVDLAKIASLGLPFWLAGGYGRPEQLQAALAAGAAGIQVGSLFAFCQESGLDAALKEQVIQQVLEGTINVYTDPVASPTGYPFKLVPLPGTAAEAETYTARPRICDLGYLRQPYKRQDGTIDYRCPAEPVEDYLRKGGDLADTVGRKCLCNGLLANLGLGQHRADGQVEPPLITAGDDLQGLRKMVNPTTQQFFAREVIDYLLSSQPLAVSS